jgi:hypothetical protein
MSGFTAIGVLPGALAAAVLIVLAGCASGPAPAATAANGPRSKAAAQEVALSTKHLTKVQKLIAEARQAGLPDFYAVVRNGHTDYCWRGKNIGTLIPSTKCVNSAQSLRQVLQALSAERHQMMERAGGMCGGKADCAGN